MRDQQRNLIDWEEVDQAHEAVNKVNREWTDFGKLMPKPGDKELNQRTKRGLINFRGDLLKFIFDVATTI
jgi:hypothetical protein